MATTNNLSLAVLGGGDFVRYEVLNENFEALDRAALCRIIARGVSGGWYWRRWSDGIAECWQKLAASVRTSIALGSGYRSQDMSLTFPIAFDEPPNVSVTTESGGTFLIAQAGKVTETWASIRFAGFEDATHTGALCTVHVLGTVGG